MSEEPIIIDAIDIDGTALRFPLFNSLSHFLLEGHANDTSGELRDLFARTRRAWQRREATFDDYFAAALEVQRAGMFKGVLAQVVEDFARSHAESDGHRPYVFTQELIAVLKESGHHLLAVSGSPEAMVRVYCERNGIDHFVATTLPVDEHGRLTGDVVSTAFDDKAAAVRSYQATLGRPSKVMVAIGDSLADLSMLHMAKYPIAFGPNAELDAAAHRFGIPIVVEDRNVIRVLAVYGDGTTRRTPRSYAEAPLSSILPHPIARRLAERITARKYKIR